VPFGPELSVHFAFAEKIGFSQLLFLACESSQKVDASADGRQDSKRLSAGICARMMVFILENAGIRRSSRGMRG